MILRALLLLLTACDAEPTGACGPTQPGQEECPLDPCAASCATVAEGLACCVEAHGRGLAGEDVERLASGCPTCDPAALLSAEAALCAAQVQGLEPGVGWCGGYVDVVDGAGAWYVRNTTFDGCEAGEPEVRGDGMQLDGVTGVADGAYELTLVVECPA